MMKERAKKVIDYTDKIQEVNTDFLIDSNDAFFDMIDGVSERQNTLTSNVIKFALMSTLANLEVASDFYNATRDLYTNGK